MITLTSFAGITLPDAAAVYDWGKGGVIAPSLTGVGGQSFEGGGDDSIFSARELSYSSLWSDPDDTTLRATVAALRTAIGKKDWLQGYGIVDGVLLEQRARLLSLEATSSYKSTKVIPFTPTWRLLDQGWTEFTERTSVHSFSFVDGTTDTSLITIPFTPVTTSVCRRMSIEVNYISLTQPIGFTLFGSGGFALSAALSPQAPYSTATITPSLKKSVLVSTIDGNELDNYANFKPAATHKNREWFNLPAAIPDPLSIQFDRGFDVSDGAVIITFRYHSTYR